MRFLPVFVLSALPAVAIAQATLTPVQKSPQDAPAATLSAAELGLPSDPALQKTGVLVASRATDSATSDFDTDKIAGNEPVSAPLILRSKAPGSLPDPAPAAADLGTGPAGEKVAVVEASKAIEGATTTYDTDKIDGNAETYPPLTLRQKAPGSLPEGVTTADLGQPATAPDPKAVDLAVSHAAGVRTIYDEDKIDGNEPPPAPLTERQKAPSVLEGDVTLADLGQPATPATPKTEDFAASYAEAVPSIYDEDKIAGNEPVYEDSYDQGPLAARQKYPSELAEGTDPGAFGQPAVVAPKEADLGVSKAEIAVQNVEDNDKIAGNPYVAPPILPRQKLPSVLPDPVVDADMGQPAIAAPKQDMAVSKAADGQPTFEDNDKIAGNPVVSPPLAERAKLPATEPAIAGLTDEDLGLPVAPPAEKNADVAASKTAEGALTEYDEDKIAGNSYQDPAFGDEYAEESYDPAPPPELTAQVRALLDDPATRSAVLEGVASRGLAPEPVVGAFQAFMGQLFDAPEVRDLMAEDIARVFMNVGLTPENPAALGRVAAEYMATFGETEASFGVARLSVDDQRAYLTATLRTAETLPPAQCAPFLADSMDKVQQRRLLLAALANVPEEARFAVLANRAAAILAQVKDSLHLTSISEQEVGVARARLGEDVLAAIDAMENGPDLLAAYGDLYLANAEDSCAVQKLIISTALAKQGADADLGVQYLAVYGWRL